MNPGFTSVSLWLFGIVFLLFTGLFVVLLRIQRKRIQLEHELDIQKYENEKLAEIDRLKSRFFANLSHEFRTLLTLINGPLELIKHNIDETVIRQNLPLRPFEQIKRQISHETARKNYQIIQNNTHLFSRLINQLLDLSKLDTGKLALKTKPVEIISVLRNIVLSFTPHAQNHDITLTFQTKIEALFAYIDMDKFEIIINNLLSNAVKFTPMGGRVAVDIERAGDSMIVNDRSVECFEIRVSDTGMGIPEDQVDKIFDRFYQYKPEHANVKEGMGIGLSLTKELLELHYGSINVSSVPGQGTTFTLCLPVGKTHLKESEIVAEYIKVQDVNEARREYAVNIQNTRTANNRNQLVLIVEDNPEMRSFIRSCLQAEYQIIEAENGREALSLVADMMPDVIISDIMMPDMDGLEFCKHLKQDNRINHIQLIFLTARAEDQDVIKGFECGADEYLVKPFNAHELDLRLQNLLKQRHILRKKIRKDVMIEPDETQQLSMDEEFIIKARDLIQAHIGDFDYSVNDFASDMAMSRFHLNRKLQHIIEMSPSRFMREIRLRKAAQYLEAKKGRVSEIALDVGFDNFAYFTRCFKEKYGCSPSCFSEIKSQTTEKGEPV